MARSHESSLEIFFKLVQPECFSQSHIPIGMARTLLTLTHKFRWSRRFASGVDSSVRLGNDLDERRKLSKRALPVFYQRVSKNRSLSSSALLVLVNISKSTNRANTIRPSDRIGHSSDVILLWSHRHTVSDTLLVSREYWIKWHHLRPRSHIDTIYACTAHIPTYAPHLFRSKTNQFFWFIA